MYCTLVVVFVKYPTTTKTYTYWHTLSLHDALPISAPFGANAVARHTLARQIGGHRIGPALRQAHVVFVTAGRVGMADDMNDRLVIALENAGNLRVRIQRKIGRASCRERVCQYVSISVVAVSLKKKQ